MCACVWIRGEGRPVCMCGRLVCMCADSRREGARTGASRARRGVRAPQIASPPLPPAPRDPPNRYMAHSHSVT
eukprot:1128858-Rhodomonas_salina.1